MAHSDVTRLYRRLLKLAPSPPLQLHVRRQFRLPSLHHRLAHATKLLDHFERLPSEPTLQAYYRQLSDFLALAAPPARSSPPAPPPPPPKKPILTPGILHATPYHPPLPRLKPQPEHLSMMIFNRRRAIQRKWDRLAVLRDRADDLREEAHFAARLGPPRRRSPDEDWGASVREETARLEASARADKARAELRISPEMRDRAIAANKFREAQRRAKGAKSRRSAGA